MAFRRTLELDDVCNADILKAHEEGRLALRPGMGTFHCPDCGGTVGVCLPGNAFGRSTTSSPCLIFGTAESARAAHESGDVVLVVPKIWTGPRSGLPETGRGTDVVPIVENP